MIQAVKIDVVVIGAGAAGLMCAAQAGKRGRKVWVLDHAKKIGEKIRISGGGRCNFTNLYCDPSAFLSQNPHFCKSALQHYTQYDFIDLVNQYGIAWHEKRPERKLGQLFCDDSAQQIIDMLLSECHKANVVIHRDTSIDQIQYDGHEYHMTTSRGVVIAQSLVVATGGLSIPKIGATGFGYRLATQFGLNIIPTRAALVPLTFQDTFLTRCQTLSGVSVEAKVQCGNQSFSEGLLFTHRGLSGPSILQISSYWQEGEALSLNLSPDQSVFTFLKGRKLESPKQLLQTILSDLLPKRLVLDLGHDSDDMQTLLQKKIAEIGDKTLMTLATRIESWSIKPTGTEGYRTAEVTLGGVDTDHISSKSMQVKTHENLYFIGEVLDVTGHLGGYNFQWAWSSGYVAGQYA